MVKITGVLDGSKAQIAGVSAGEYIFKINDFEINDVLDYQFYCAESRLVLLVGASEETAREVVIEKGEYQDIGLEFETYLMDNHRKCKNKCIFCFMDQLPPGLRESLYFKDDDARLSFLFGNYITLTNVTDAEVERIIKMKISPVNISVHTTNEALRCEMMGNKQAGEALRHMNKLCSSGIKINCQLVLCSGYNDGEELRSTLADLKALYPAVQSVAATPAGLTRYREGLTPLVPFDKTSAAAVIETVNEFADICQKEFGERIFYPADEFFNLAGSDIPEEGYYGTMPQLSNGVGGLALFKADFVSAVDSCEKSSVGGRFTIATGTAAAPLLKSLVDYAAKRWHNVECRVVAIKNVFFGESVTTAGLITGNDLIAGLKELTPADIGTLLIPSVMLRAQGDLFLDDRTVEDVERKLGAAVKVLPPSGDILAETLLGTEN